MGLLPFGLLIAALLVFLFGTRQFALWLRAVIWIIGAGCLGFAAFIVANDPVHFGLFRIVADFFAHPADSVMAQALERNSPTAIRFVLPLLDLFLIFAAILGVLALLSFSPGEDIEKAVRPLAIGLIGVIVGGIVALVVVGVGFGGPVKPQGYVGYLRAENIHDGDTFWVGEISLRLFGADAPELDQSCRDESGLTPCGESARARLAEMLDGQLILCTPRLTRTGTQKESFGRPLVSCEVRPAAAPAFDVVGRMIEEGYSVQYEGRDWGYSSAALRGQGQHLMATCMLRPDFWRQRGHMAQDAFVEGRLEEIPVDALVGIGCPQLAPPPNLDNPR